MDIRAALAIVAIMLTACGPEAASDVGAEVEQPALESIAPRFDAAAIERARALIAAEPKVLDVMFDENDVVEWHVAVAAEGGSRLGFAQYLCLVLSDEGVVDDHTSVRVVDIAKIVANPGDFRGASLGHADCNSGDSLGT